LSQQDDWLGDSLLAFHHQLEAQKEQKSRQLFGRQQGV